MINKKLLSTIIAASAIGVCSIAFANGAEPAPIAAQSNFQPGFYLGVQAGFGNADQGETFQHLFDSADNTLASNSDYVVGSTSSSYKKGGFAGRGYIGYSLFPWLSVEAGYTQFTNNKDSLALAYTVNVPETALTPAINANINTNMAVTYKTWAIDLVAKGIWQVTDAWSLFAKAGLAYVNVTNQIDVWGSASVATPGGTFVDPITGQTFVIPATSDGASGSDSTKNTNSVIRPTYGVGVAYNFTPEFAMDLAWTGIYGTIYSSSNMNVVQIPNTNMFTLGLSYKF